jgi:hypothetical protein
LITETVVVAGGDEAFIENPFAGRKMLIGSFNSSRTYTEATGIIIEKNMAT